MVFTVKGIIGAALSVLDKVLNIFIRRSESDNLRRQRSAERDGETRDQHERIVKDAQTTGDLADIRRRASQ